jgi:hypothetical protein
MSKHVSKVTPCLASIYIFLTHSRYVSFDEQENKQKKKNTTTTTKTTTATTPPPPPTTTTTTTTTKHQQRRRKRNERTKITVTNLGNDRRDFGGIKDAEDRLIALARDGGELHYDHENE